MTLTTSATYVFRSHKNYITVYLICVNCCIVWCHSLAWCGRNSAITGRVAAVYHPSGQEGRGGLAPLRRLCHDRSRPSYCTGIKAQPETCALSVGAFETLDASE